MRVEIGSGDFPREGYYHFDVRANVPDLDCRADVRYLPIKDGTVDELIAIQVLEHVPYQETHKVLAEMRRVLRLGGMAKIYVPDLKLIAQQILEQKIDFTVLVTWIYGGGRGYDEDFHKAGFTIEYLSMLLCNFKIVSIVDGNGIYAEVVK